MNSSAKWREFLTWWNNYYKKQINDGGFKLDAMEYFAIKIIDDKIFLKISVEERPRLSRYNFRGIRKGEAQEIKNKLNLVKAKVVTEAAKKESIVRIKKFFEEKGYGSTLVKIKEKKDSVIVNSVILTFC